MFINVLTGIAQWIQWVKIVINQSHSTITMQIFPGMVLARSSSGLASH